MIILQLGGGLGNQMFEYCFAKWLQNETNEKIIFDCNDIKKNEIEDREFSLINFNIAETHIGNKYLTGICEFIFKALYWGLRKVHNFNALSDDEYYMIMSHYGIYKCKKIYDGPKQFSKKRRIKFVSGNFQNIFYVNQIPNIKKLFSIRCKLDASNEKLVKEIRNEESVCVHIRRGDYLSPLYSDLNVCSEEYYIKAMKYIESKLENPVFYIFSNTHEDIEWIKSNMKFRDKWNIKYVDQNNKDYVELFLMKSCYSFIISNSTFSWWAQYLSENENKIVVAPSIWNKEEIYKNESKKIYISDWHLIDV